MRHIKEFNQLFESTQELTQEQKDWLDKCVLRGSIKGSTWSVNPQTGLVDITGDFWLYKGDLTDFKGVRFGNVSESFNCSDNSLTSLEGAPQSVGDAFNCSGNSLASLEGAPQSVGGNFYCNNNSLTSLEGGPQTVNGFYNCSRNSLTTLRGAPQEVGGDFYCSHNSLTTLEGAPQWVGGYFDCRYNSLTSLKGGPKRVGSGFNCEDNPLASLEGAPQWVGGDKRGANLHFKNNILSERSVKTVLREMFSKRIPLEQAVTNKWSYIPKEDRPHLAKHHLGLSPDERKGYEAIVRLKSRVI